MIFQSVFCDELFAAHLALVHVHSRVRLHVSVERRLLLEGFVTEGALVRRLVLVYLFVHAQCL